MDLEELDSNLQAAVAKAEETGTTTPILKQVLKLFIQSSRLKNGKEELPKSEFKEPEKYPLTAEEEWKKEVRRERNRVAARKCRQKKKTAVEEAEDNFREEMNRKNKLLRMIKDLEEEKKTLEGKLGLSVEVEMEAPEKPPAKRMRRNMDKGTETCNTLPAKNPTKTGFTADRKTPAPQSSTPLKHGTPSHSPLPVPTRPPPPYTPTLQSPSFHLQDSCSQLNQGSCYASDTPPAHVFTPLEISTSRDFDPLFTYTSPGLAHRFSRPSSTSTTTYTEMLAESLTPHTPSSLHVFTEPPSFESPTAQFCPKSSPAFHTPYESPEILAQSPPSASLHVITESPLLEAPRTQPSPYQPESMFDLLAMSPSSEFFRPQSPPALSTPWTESSPYGDIPTLPSESPSFRSCSSEYFSFETQLSQEQLVPLDKFQTSFTGSSINIPPGNIPATVFETLEKEAQVPGNVLSTDDELLSSQEAELLTLYG